LEKKLREMKGIRDILNIKQIFLLHMTIYVGIHFPFLFFSAFSPPPGPGCYLNHPPHKIACPWVFSMKEHGVAAVTLVMGQIVVF
jgi:hypothetical protein